MNLKRTYTYRITREILTYILFNGLNFIARLTTKVDPKKIVFTTQQGSYTCNPKAICEEIIKRKLDYKLVWATNTVFMKDKELKKQFPKEVELVQKRTLKYYKELNSAKILIENEHNYGRRWLYKKRKGQVMIDTWHGSMGLKRIAVDNSFSAHYVIKKNIRYQKQTDYIISNSTFENEIYRQTYWPKNEILEYGHPRNDILFKRKNSDEVKKLNSKVRELLKLPKDTKLFLYAPTFREKNRDINTRFEIDYNKIRKALEKKFGGKWSIIVRFHHKEIDMHKDYDKKYGVIDATKYPDMQELLSVVDIGVTDYSSWICDFVLTGKPGFLLTPDLKEYQEKDRGFYYSLDETPFPISYNTDDLIKDILEFDEKKYKIKKDKFLSLRGCFEDGHACDRVLDLIDKIINQ